MTSYAFEFDLVHGVLRDLDLTNEEVKFVVNNAKPPYPVIGVDAEFGEEHWVVFGLTADRLWLQVVYLIDEGGRVFPVDVRKIGTAQTKQARTNIANGSLS